MSNSDSEVEEELQQLREINTNINDLDQQIKTDVNQTVQFLLAAEPAISSNVQKIANNIEQIDGINQNANNIDNTLNKFLTAIALLFIILALAVLVIAPPLLHRSNCNPCYSYIIVFVAVAFLLFLGAYFLYC